MWFLSPALAVAILLLQSISASPAKRDDVVLVVEGSSIIEVPVTTTPPPVDIIETPSPSIPEPQPDTATPPAPTDRAGAPFISFTTSFGLPPNPTNIPGIFTVGTLTVTPFLSPQITQSAVSKKSLSSSKRNPSESTSITLSRPKILRGVNLGGWLVLEKWISPDVFSGAFSSAVDQYTFDSLPGASTALQTHWNTFITLTDIQKIAATGINALRIPIGYWAYNNSNTPYLKGADVFLERAITWARSTGMVVWVDCHGSPGSQNGFDNSGHAGEVLWQQDDNLNRSIAVLKTIAAKYGAQQYADVVVGIELVNEPVSGGNNNLDTTKKWAQDAYGAVRAAAANKKLQIVMHDAFEGPEEWIDTAKSIQNQDGGDQRGSMDDAGFAIDTHLYQLFNPSENTLTQAQHIDAVCDWAASLSAANKIVPVYVGEFSAATNICVSPDGSTVAGTSISGIECQANTAVETWSQAMKDQVRRYVEVQLDVFEQNTMGWFLWTAKGPGAWGFLNGVEGGWIPNPVTSRKFAGQCSIG